MRVESRESEVEIRRLFALAIATILIAAAQSISLANPNSAFPLLKNGRIAGSAVMVEGGYALTAEHVMVMGPPTAIGNRPFVALNTPPLDNTDDAVLLRVEGYNGPVSRIATKAPKAGDKVYTVGFSNGKRTALSGRVTYVYETHRGQQHGVRDAAYAIEADFAIQPGHSGGPLWNEAGELVGLCHGSMKGAGKLLVPPSVWIGTPSIHNALAFANPPANFAAISPDKPDLVVITARGCLPCRTVKDDARAGGYAGWNVIFIEWDGKAKTWGVPWTYTDGRQELHGELDAAQLYRQFQEQTGIKQGVQAPHFWMRYTKHHFPGKHNVKAWLQGLASAVVSQVIDEPPPIAATEPKPNNSTPFAPAPPQLQNKEQQQYQRSTDSRVDGLLSTVNQLREDVAAAIETAKQAKQHGEKFSEASLIGKARAGMALKSDVAELRERAGKVKDGMTELMSGMKNPANWLHVGWGIFAAWYRKRKGTA